MDVGRPHAVFASPLDVDVLLVLRRTSRPLTGRDVARLVGRASEAGVRKALTRLRAQGVVRAEEAGRALMYTLNREHLAVPALEVLATMRAELERRVGRVVEGWSIQPEHLSLFGSTARGDGSTLSDIDMFVVRSDNIDEDADSWRAQLDALVDDTQAWTGNRVAISEVSTRDVKRLRRQRPPIVAELRDHAITLAGSDIRELFGRTG